jgi:hypothetical protein
MAQSTSDFESSHRRNGELSVVLEICSGVRGHRLIAKLENLGEDVRIQQRKIYDNA